MLTLTYAGSVRVMPNYNVMGVAKAGLEASVRYLANDYGPRGHPRQRDLGRADPHACGRRHFRCARTCSPTSSATRRCGAPSPSTRSAVRRFTCCRTFRRGVTGEIHYVDSGYHIVSMPVLDELKRFDEGREPA